MLPARANPFRMQRIERLHYRFDDDGWRRLFVRFGANHWRGVLVGPHGSGKTTLREEIEARLRADGWEVRSLVLGDGCAITWNGLQSWMAGAGSRTLLSVDGLDRIGAMTWWRLRHAARDVGGILATSHRAGRLPLLHRHTTSVALLADLIRELVGEAYPEIDERRCGALFRRHRGDLRACLRALYDAAATGDEAYHALRT
jgi:hypothetical protein